MSPIVPLQTLPSLVSLAILGAILVSIVESRRFQFVNNCPFPVWPGILNNHGKPALSSTGFGLKSHQRRTLNVPESWGGRMWGRTGCSQKGGTFKCRTGDCGGLACGGRSGATPTTLAEFTLNGHGGADFYDVSLVDGFDIPIGINPRRGCPVSECKANVNRVCPKELAVNAGRKRVGCKSACSHFGKPEYCCAGNYKTPDKCRPSQYSKVFANACPKAYSYAYDDKRGTFTCVGGDYVIIFCP